VITGFARFAARESGSIENTARPVPRLLKNWAPVRHSRAQIAYFCCERLFGNGLMELHKILISDANRRELS
jgi:hypothetical protein